MTGRKSDVWEWRWIWLAMTVFTAVVLGWWFWEMLE
jgi:hypothetical protein